MRLKDHGTSIALWISAGETERWASRWSCSTLGGKRIACTFDRHGLLDLTINGRMPGIEIDGHEFNALTSDFLARRLGKDHPCYFVAVGQFREARQ